MYSIIEFNNNGPVQTEEYTRTSVILKQAGI